MASFNTSVQQREEKNNNNPTFLGVTISIAHKIVTATSLDVETVLCGNSPRTGYSSVSSVETHHH